MSFCLINIVIAWGGWAKEGVSRKCSRISILFSESEQLLVDGTCWSALLWAPCCFCIEMNGGSGVQRDLKNPGLPNFSSFVLTLSFVYNLCDYVLNVKNDF